MVYRRYSRYRSRRPRRFRRRYTRARKFSRRRMFRRRRPSVITIKRRFFTTQTVLDNETFYSSSMALSDVTYSDFQNFFEYYKIKGVRWEFSWTCEPPTTDNYGITPTLVPPIFRYEVDYNDVTTPTTAYWREANNAKSITLRGNRTIKVYIRPKTLVQYYRSAIAAAYANPRREPWQQMLYPDMPYYGMKWGIDASYGGGTGTTQIGRLYITRTYYIALKGSK